MTDQLNALGVPANSIYDITCRPVGGATERQYYRCLVVAKNSGDAIRRTTAFFKSFWPEDDIKAIDIQSLVLSIGPAAAIVIGQ